MIIKHAQVCLKKNYVDVTLLVFFKLYADILASSQSDSKGRCCTFAPSAKIKQKKIVNKSYLQSTCIHIYKYLYKT